MLFRTRSKEVAWEVVDTRDVEPICMYSEDEDLDLEAISDYDIRGTYVFDIKTKTSYTASQSAIVFAQQQLLKEVEKKGYNIFLNESWRLTVLRRKAQYRLEVEYCGRPAHVHGETPAIKPPPFMEVLRT
ncbi:hypothetical protein D9758_002370 [Tetrapyrgos nigripes]|uniref:Uncharacterized protein n=1 Tax=Tetrapyrgos nigripes TaxID=182062 RepID=A0A8H5GNT8_9AGAR|nr:hypothetical protein D9758_002370 [Tetrapyrgos nigripes]